MTPPQFFARAGIGLIAAATATTSILMVPGFRGVLGAALAVLMLAIVIIDTRHFIVPNELTLAGLLLGIVHALLGEPGSHTWSWAAWSSAAWTSPPWSSAAWSLAVAALRGTVLALVFLAIRETYFRLRGREGIGLGDVKLAAVAGVWLDWAMLPIAVNIAALGAIVGYLVTQHIRHRPIRMDSRLPFGAFLAASIWIGWILDEIIRSGLL